MNRTCIVTGGAGFIGCALSHQIVEHFDNILAVDNLHPQIHANQVRPEALHPKVELVVGDICDAETWDKILEKSTPTVVFHLAAETGTGQSLTEASRHAITNVVGTTVMLDAFLRHKKMPTRIVLSSSRAVYGEGAWKVVGSGELYYPGQRSANQLNSATWNFDGVPVAMDASRVSPAPVSVYGATKLAQENILSAWANSVGSEYVIFRLQNVFGPGQSLINSYTGIVSLFCQLARDKKPIPLYEDGQVQRDFILIADVVEALALGVKTPGISGQIFDIGSGVPTTLLQLAENIADLYGAPKPEINGKYRFGDVRHAFSNIHKANEILGWFPKNDLNGGLTKLKEWIQRQSENG